MSVRARTGIRARTRAAAVAAAAVLASVLAASAQAGVLEQIRARGQLRVCAWPEYYGISWRDPRSGRWSGLDVDLAQALAGELGVPMTPVESSFTTLVDDLERERCDIAMYAVAMLPARVARLRFSRPYLQSDIYAITTRGNRVVRDWQDIDRPGVAVAVQAGTFMEPVMAATLQHASLVRVSPPATRERELEAGRVDVFMTDYPYSRRLLDNADWARLIAPPQPFHVLPYAYPVKPGDEAWAARVDAFVAAIQRDGRLRGAAQRHGLEAIVQSTAP